MTTLPNARPDTIAPEITKAFPTVVAYDLTRRDAQGAAKDASQVATNARKTSLVTLACIADRAIGAAGIVLREHNRISEEIRVSTGRLFGGACGISMCATPPTSYCECTRNFKPRRRINWTSGRIRACMRTAAPVLNPGWPQPSPASPAGLWAGAGPAGPGTRWRLRTQPTRPSDPPASPA